MRHPGHLVSNLWTAAAGLTLLVVAIGVQRGKYSQDPHVLLSWAGYSFSILSASLGYRRNASTALWQPSVRNSLCCLGLTLLLIAYIAAISGLFALHSASHRAIIDLMQTSMALMSAFYATLNALFWLIDHSRRTDARASEAIAPPSPALQSA